MEVYPKSTSSLAFNSFVDDSLMCNTIFTLQAFAARGYVAVAIDCRYHGERAASLNSYNEVSPAELRIVLNPLVSRLCLLHLSSPYQCNPRTFDQEGDKNEWEQIPKGHRRKRGLGDWQKAPTESLSKYHWKQCSNLLACFLAPQALISAWRNGDEMPFIFDTV